LDLLSIIEERMGYTESQYEVTPLHEEATNGYVIERRPRRRHNYALHIILFVLTFASTTFTALVYFAPTTATTPEGVLADWTAGLPFGLLLMLFLTAHEFGHYFAARYHDVDATLPFYIPMPFMMFGTMGAVIRTRSQIPSRKALFDIGVAGPLAGFVVALTYLIIGIATMPGIEQLYAIHPQYRHMPIIPEEGIHFGGFLLLDILKSLMLAPEQFFPPMNEIYHYPFLCVGWFGMFVTALNMIPVGQLDGGHIIYAMFGRHQVTISKWFVRFLIFAGLGTVGAMLLEATRAYNPDGLYQFLQTVFGPPMEWIVEHASWWLQGWFGWLLWVLILKYLIKIPHPPVPDEEPIGTTRMVIGWVSLAILVLTFSFSGIFEVVSAVPAAP
jgi:membrane-associated protease RseP (regulator of RpoE activity)